MNEQELVRTYMRLTGCPESAARSVFMYVCPSNGKAAPPIGPNSTLAGDEQPATRVTLHGHQPKKATVLILLMILLGIDGLEAYDLIAAASSPSRAGGETNVAAVRAPFNAPLSLADAINLALHQNPALLQAQKDLEANQGIVIQTRAIALPTVGIAGNYGAVEQTDIDIFQVPEFTFGTPQNWSAQVKLVQSFYQGGRILSALRAARLSKQQSLLKYEAVLADTVLNVQIAYYDVLLAVQQIIVQEASVQLLTNQLADTTRRFEAGTVPRFNVLRAEVELANARPKLINARNNFRVSKNVLANVLGLVVPQGTFEDIPLVLSGKLEAEPYDLELPRAIATALERRSELGALRKAEALRKEDITSAKAGYKPVVQGYVGYDYHNSMLSSDLVRLDRGWIAGAQLSWNLFDGLRTQGKIKEATANYERAGVELDDRTRTVELEVRTAYSNFIEAREVLDSQKKVMEEAEEAVRLARARSEAGTGTQLDELSAQTALTEARSTQIQALHDYEAARARLQRAVGVNIPSE